MRLKQGFVLREVCGERVIMAEGIDTIDFSKLVCLNETAAVVWEKATALGEFTSEQLADGLCEGMGKDADVDATEAADGLGAQVAVAHTGKAGEVVAVGGVVQMIELAVGGDAQIDDVPVQGNLVLDMLHLADADLGLNISLAVAHDYLHIVVIVVGSVSRDACYAAVVQSRHIHLGRGREVRFRLSMADEGGISHFVERGG